MIARTIVTLSVVLMFAYYSNSFLLPTNPIISSGIRSNRQLSFLANKAEPIENDASPLPSFEDILPEAEEDLNFIDEIANLAAQEGDEDEEDEEEEISNKEQEDLKLRAEAKEGEEEESSETEEDFYAEYDEDDEIDFSPIFEDSPNFEPPEGLIEKLLEREAEIAARRIPYDQRVDVIARKAARVKHQRHEKDSGSPEVQIAMMHERILHLTKHLFTHRKDNHSKRGLDRLVTLRRKNLNYLYQQDSKKAVALAAELGIRFSPPGRAWDRSAKYSSYKNTKKQFKISKEELEARRIKETQKVLEL